MFPERAETAMQHLEAAETRGEFDNAGTCQDLTVSLNAVLTGELHDQHLRVNCIPTESAADSSRTAKPIADRYHDFDRMTGERDNYGVRAVAQLSGNVGYLRISGFPDGAIIAAPLTHAFALLQHTDSLIVDVRDNHGGDPQAVALLESYFFEPWKPRELNEVIARQQSGFDTHQYWTTPVPAGLYYDREVYVLTSSHTISAGEGFSYEMQAEKRATVVGEVTAGAANPATEILLGDGVMASIPFGRALNPVTKT
ncbi:MAG TPA: S41 family peptidase, partial [Vicinamibacterales bacterium]